MDFQFDGTLPVSAICSFPASIYNHPRVFRAAWDSPELDQKQYDKGREVGEESEYITITEKGTWVSQLENGASSTSYEIIGYHASTAALLAGFLDSGTQVYVARESGTTRIR